MKNPTLLALTLLSSYAVAQNRPLDSDPPLPMAATSDGYEKAELMKQGTLLPLKKAKEARGAIPTKKRTIDKDFVSFLYAQTYGGSGQTYTDHYRWEGITHVGSTFITFDASGNILNPGTWTGRDEQLRAGGGAEAAGVDVIMVVLNSGFDVSVINDVMTSPSARANLISDIKDLLDADGYSHGVSFDFEPFQWSSDATAGMALFFEELRTALGPDTHISVYADPTPSSVQWDLTSFNDTIDYFMYSCYDYGQGSTPRAVSDFDNYSYNIGNFYLDGGVDPSKLVSVISTYGRTTPGTNTYGVAGTSGAVSGRGFTDGLYDTTIRGLTPEYARGDETSWYTFNQSGTDYVVSWDSPESLEMKIRASVNYHGHSADPGGVKMGGVGFWSARWLADVESITPGGVTPVDKTRMYPHVFQLCQEILAPAGTKEFIAASFESLDFRWRDPNDSSDTLNVAASRGLVLSPGGTGAPENTTNAMELSLNFTSNAANRAFFRYEPLWDDDYPGDLDYHAMAAVFSANTKLTASVYTPSGLAGYTVRLAVLDANQEVELGPTFPLTAGWQEIDFDLTKPATGHTTSEVALKNGDGVVDGNGGKFDVGLLGFLIEGSGIVNGTVVLDEVMYTSSNPTNESYVINEFAYEANDSEYVEIYGTPGTIPNGVELRFYGGEDGDVTLSIPLGGMTISPAGFLTIGDPATGATVTAGFSDANDDIFNGFDSEQYAGGIQLVDTTSNYAFDSVVYEAFVSLRDLRRPQTLGLTANGGPWVGQVGPGTYAIGRYPDGANTFNNSNDFSAMARSVGTSNGGKFPLGLTLDFNTPNPPAVQTFDWVSAGVVASPPIGGTNVYRVADSSGGVIAFLGDKSIGYDGAPYRIYGDVYIPGINATESSQAIAVGFCGTQGTTFFADDPTGSGYENGYWLIYHSDANVILNNDLGNHEGEFVFGLASHDHQDSVIFEELGRLSASSASIAAGSWSNFDFTIDPSLNQLTASIGGQLVYTGPIPENGPTSGAIQVGHREDHSGGTLAGEGTWVDNISYTPLNMRIDGFMLLGD